MNKRIILSGLIIFFFLSIVSAFTFNRINEIYEELEVTREEAKERFLESLANGILVKGDHPDLVKNARQMPEGIRVIAIRELLKMGREYTLEKNFAADYKAWRKKKLNPDQKTKLGLPKLGKIVDNKMNNALDKGKNEELYPEDPNKLLRMRLEEFLEISATVDFDAELNGGQFVNSEYIKKDARWKMSFRAGKPVIEAAREIAADWLKELE